MPTYARNVTPWICALALLGQACLSTRLVKLNNVDAPLPPVAVGHDWRADLSALLAAYERAPVLAPEDARLPPLFGGMTTLSFFGADAEPRVRDQQLKQGSSSGLELEAACTPREETATEPEPQYRRLWIPLALRGGVAPAAVRCDEHGHASSEDSFCVFARLALHARPAPLILVVHGMFDSGAQDYVQHMAATLFRMGHAVLLPDMRDHGDTYRAAPQLATTLGALEGADLLALAQLARGQCGSLVTHVGVLGMSGGGLDAIRAFSADAQGQLDAGVLALSPLLDVDAAIRDLSDTGDCAITRSVELTWSDNLLLGAATGAGFALGAGLSDLARDQRVDGTLALAGGVGFGVGLLGALAVDAWLDGGSEPCVSYHAIASIVQDCLRVRWRSFQAPELHSLLSAAGHRIQPQDVTLGDYLRERAAFRAEQQGLPFLRPTAASLAAEVRRAMEKARPHARLLVLGAQDDPMTRSGPLHAFIERTRGVEQVYAHAVRHGGHASLWVVQPRVMGALFQRFFTPTPASAAASR